MGNKAIAIGINHYDFLHPLRYAKNDALHVRDFLLDPNGAGFETVWYFSDDSPDVGGKTTRPIRNNLRRVLNQLSEGAPLSGTDTVWFFFAGHGILHNDGVDYLMPSDGDPDDPADTAIPTSFVLQKLRSCGAGNIILALDACRNQVRREGTQRAGRGIGDQTEREAKQIADTICFSACSPNEFSYEMDELQHGAFTYALVEGLGVQGKCATVERLGDYLKHRVPVLAKAKQTPRVAIDPYEKGHLILMPKHAKKADLALLKVDAGRAERAGELTQALLLWRQVLAVDGTDEDALEAIVDLRKRLDANPQTGETTLKESPQNVETPAKSASNFREEVKRKQIAALQDEIESIRRQWESSVDDAQRLLLSRRLEQRLGELEALEVFPSPSKGERLGVRSNAPTPRETPKPIALDCGNGITLELVPIPAGKFTMGMPPAERKIALDNAIAHGASKKDVEAWLDWSTPPHEVNLQSFWMGKYTVTNAQWHAVMGTKPSEKYDRKFHGDKQPVVGVSWHNARAFCTKLSQTTGNTIRLPTEAEWEYACRAGTTTPFHFGETITPELVNYDGNYPYANAPKGEYRERTVDVDTFSPNAWGLHQMHGNVWEWCLDEFHENYSAKPDRLKQNGNEPWGEFNVDENDNRSRLLRGGSWDNLARNCRSAYRLRSVSQNINGNVGLRVVFVSSL